MFKKIMSWIRYKYHLNTTGDGVIHESYRLLRNKLEPGRFSIDFSKTTLLLKIGMVVTYANRNNKEIKYINNNKIETYRSWVINNKVEFTDGTNIKFPIK